MMHRLVACVVCLLIFLPRLAPALDLGSIEARSALYGPLDARIALDGAQSGDLEELKVKLGSPAQFELAGVARQQHLNLLQFTVVEQDDGGSYIHVWTDEPIIEPSLTFLIDVDWPRGRTVRGYKLHLSAAVGDSADASPSRRTTPEAEGESETRASVTPADSSPASATYGPVRSSETLWSISARLRPDGTVSVQRMMLAILDANPEAFVIRNVNALNAGTTLHIPTRDDLGPDDVKAVTAEVKRQNAAWQQYRERGPAAPAPSTTPVPVPSTHEFETEPSGRIEVVSPETTMNVAGREEGADTQALRNELALAIEEADAGRRENDELKLRLAEAEDHIKELSRLVDLKNEEIAALQSKLRTMAETEPKPVPAEAETTPAPSEAGAAPVPMEVEVEADPAPAEAESKPVLAPAEAEPKPVLAPVEAEPAPAEAEPKSLPFNLDALPVNPVFLVGGAGLLLILLGVAALLRRRRASAVEDGASDVASDVADASPAGEDNLLLELEAVAAELADETADPLDRRARSAPAAGSAGGMALETMKSDVQRSEQDSLTEKRIAELWTDDPETERILLAEVEADDDTADVTFDIDALTGDDPDLSMLDDETSDDFDIADLADLADLAADREADPTGTVDEASGSIDHLFTRHDAPVADSEAAESVSTAGAGDPPDLDSGILDRGRRDAPPATPDDDSRGSSSSTAGTANLGTGPTSPPVTERSVDFELPEDDSVESMPTRHLLFDESTDDGETGAALLDDFGEDEVQTKIDLAQVYMEMGDTESARGFLEAVLAEGDADQRDAARAMLSKLA